jgi:hypothetical protein
MPLGDTYMKMPFWQSSVGDGCRVEIFCLTVGIVVLGLVGISAQAQQGDVYQCNCEDEEPRSVESIFGGVECQHGAEQDIDCLIWAKRGYAKNDYCTDAGVAPPNPAPNWNQLTPTEKAEITAQGLDPMDADGQCECFKCQINNIEYPNSEPCETYVEYYGAYCEKGKSGECRVVESGEGTIRIDYSVELAEGETSCAYEPEGEEEPPSGDGTGEGINEIQYCGGGVLGEEGPIVGANCISQSCTPDLTDPIAEATGMLYACQ